MRLLLDEMWPPALAEQLRRRGHDVEAVAELPDLGGQSDEAVFAFARREDRAIATENVPDFRLLAAAEVRAGRPHSALILTSDRAYPRRDRRTAGRFVAALDALLSSEDLRAGEYWL